MALKLPDSAVPMGDFPVARAVDIDFDDGENLQEKLDNGALGGASSEVINTLTSTDTDKPLSANQGRVLKDEVDLKANDSEVVKKTDIATTIDLSSTDKQIPSSKAVNELNLRGTRIDQSVVDKYGTEIIKYPFGRWYIDGNEIAGKFSDMPWRSACIIDITSPIISARNPWDNTWAYRNYNVQTVENKGTFVRQLESRGTASVLLDTGWQKVCTTTVEDVGVTTITPVNSYITGTIEYTVKNGICYVSMTDLKSTVSENDLSISTTMPKPAINCSVASTNTTGIVGRIYIDKNTAKLNGSFFEKNARSYCSFSYPVAE